MLVDREKKSLCLTTRTIRAHSERGREAGKAAMFEHGIKIISFCSPFLNCTLSSVLKVRQTPYYRYYLYCCMAYFGVNILGGLAFLSIVRREFEYHYSTKKSG